MFSSGCGDIFGTLPSKMKYNPLGLYMLRWSRWKLRCWLIHLNQPKLQPVVSSSIPASSALTFWDAVLAVGNVASFRSKRTSVSSYLTLAVRVLFPDGDDSHASVPLSLLQQVDFTSSPVKRSLTAGGTAAGLCLIPPVRLYNAIWQWRHWVRKLLSIHGAGGLSRFKAHVGVLTMQKL